MVNIFEIQNSTKGKICLYANGYGKLSWQFIPVLNPVAPNQIQKGMKVYNYDNSYFFATDLYEATVIAYTLEKYLQTREFPQFEENHIKCDGKQLSIVHFPEGKMSALTFFIHSNHIYLGYSLFANKQKLFSLNLALSYFKVHTLVRILNQAPTLTMVSEVFKRQKSQSNSNGKASRNNNNVNRASNTAPFTPNKTVAADDIQQVFESL